MLLTQKEACLQPQPLKHAFELRYQSLLLCLDKNTEDSSKTDSQVCCSASPFAFIHQQQIGVQLHGQSNGITFSLVENHHWQPDLQRLLWLVNLNEPRKLKPIKSVVGLNRPQKLLLH